MRWQGYCSCVGTAGGTNARAVKKLAKICELLESVIEAAVKFRFEGKAAEYRQKLALLCKHEAQGSPWEAGLF